jgi:hypothetical protein
MRPNRSAIEFPRPAWALRDEGRKLRYRFGMGGGGGGGGSGQQMSAAQKQQMQDQQATQLILTKAQPLIQPTVVYSISGNNAAQGQVLNFPLNNVGLNTELTIEVSGTIACASTETLTKTFFGLSNFFSNVSITDLSNFQRVNTTGWHLFLLQCIRRQKIFGAAYLTDTPVAMGSNLQVNYQPVAVTPAGSQPFRMFIKVPLAFHDWDLRGAIWANVTGAQWRLGLTINPNVVAPLSATDLLNSCWQSNSSVNIGVLSAVNITVYQHYFDQLPVSGNQQVLPALSLAYNYMLINTTGSTALAANSDNPVQYSNFRTYYSTVAIFDNAGTYNPGTDINYLAIQSANLIYLNRYDAYMASLMARNLFGTDAPKGVYVINHRKKPVATNQYGNMQFIINPSSVTSGAALYMGYEMLAIQSQAINAGSLQAA